MSDTTAGKAAEQAVVEGNAATGERFPFDDTRDFEDARRGFVGTSEEAVIRDGEGRAVGDLDAYRFLARDCPDTANPSLWRQSRLAAQHGLYEVTEGVYQIRGFDLSNMTVVEGGHGVLVIDPLISAETAAVGVALYRRHRGQRPVTAVLYTHSHVDHFGGVKGVISDDDVRGGVPVIAPDGFLEHAVSENVYAGTPWPAAPPTCTAPPCPSAHAARSVPGSEPPPRPDQSAWSRPPAEAQPIRHTPAAGSSKGRASALVRRWSGDPRRGGAGWRSPVPGPPPPVATRR